MDVSKQAFDSQTRFTTAGFHRLPNAILSPKPQSITIRRKSHLNRPVKASMGPPRQTPRSPASQRSTRAIATENVYDNRTEQRAVATPPPKKDGLQTDVQDFKALESSGLAVCHLRSYIRGAILPNPKDFHRMVPPRDQRCHLNWLHIPFNHERKIDVITRFSTGAFRAGIDNFTRNCIYDDADVSDTFLASITVPPLIAASESLSLPSKCQRRTPQDFEPERSLSLLTPENLGDIATWVVELPLRTVQRAIHLSHPETAKWCFDQVPSDGWGNCDLYQVHVWRRHPTTRMETIQDSLAVIIQPPWILSWQDLQDVVECTNVPSQTNPCAGMSFSYLFKHRVWDLIRDTCQKLETQYFILTTYEGWVFGKFDASNPEAHFNSVNRVNSERDQYPSTSTPSLVEPQDRWSRCLVSNVLDASQRLPNIAEGILYWVAVSMKLEGSLSTEPNSSGTIKMEDISVPPLPPSLISTGPKPPPSPRIPTSRSNHQKKSEIDSPVYFCRRTKTRGKHSYSPYLRSGRASGSSDNAFESTTRPAATEGGRFRPRSLFSTIKQLMKWLTVQGRST